MNNRIIINPNHILSYDFTSVGTYKLLLYIFTYYDFEIKKVKLEYKEIKDILKVSNKTFKNNIEELISKNIIVKINGYKYWYKLNNVKYGK